MPATGTRVRPACPADAAECLDVYRPYVESTAVSWELDAPSVGEMAARISAACDSYAWFVLESQSAVIGFAYGQCFNRLPAYQWSVQTGIYVADGHHRCGGGRLLYTRLLQRLGDRGYRRALAGITQPNEASNDFHRAMGFRDAALYRRVEWKHGRWHDVAWMQRDLPGGGDNDDPPGSLV